MGKDDSSLNRTLETKFGESQIGSFCSYQLEPHGATSLSTQRRVFQWRESLLMQPSGLL